MRGTEDLHSWPHGILYNICGLVPNCFTISRNCDEPVPVRLSEEEGILQNAPRPHAAFLWLEFQASPTGQKIIDKYEPLKSSIYAPGSKLGKITRGKKLVVGEWSAYENIDYWVKNDG